MQETTEITAPDLTAKTTETTSSKEQLCLGWRDYMWPLAFMLSASMVGLHFPLGYIGVLVVLVRSWFHDRSDFLIQLTLLIGGYNITVPGDFFPQVNLLILLISVFVLAIFKKNHVLKQITGILVFYFIAMLAFACLSEESLAVQQFHFRMWQTFFYFIIPVAAFSGRQFDVKQFMRQLYPYAFIFSWYYIIDSVILSGPVMMSRDPSWMVNGVVNTFYNLTWAPLSLHPVRMWPSGLYIFIILIYPTVKFFKLSKWQWLLVITAILISRTAMFTLGLLLCVVFLSGNYRRVLKYAGIAFGILFVLYFVDSEPYQVIDDNTYNEEEAGWSSKLRITSTVKQFNDLLEAKDEYDLAKFGTGRMAQIIPKWQLLYERNRQWIGFGWLNSEHTTNHRYIIYNDFLDNPDEAEEVATGVEVVPVNIILTVGWIGLIIHVLVFVMLLWVIRRLKYFAWNVSTMGTFAFIGLSGLTGLVGYPGLYLSALIYGITLVANREEMGGFAPATKRMRS